MRKGIGGMLLLGAIGLTAFSFGSQPGGPARPALVSRGLWEYKMASFNDYPVVEELDKLGKEGWEVVGFEAGKYRVPGEVRERQGYVFCFKRSRSD